MSTDPALVADLPRMGRGTLGRRLVLQVVALVALVAVAFSALTSIALYTSLQRELDNNVVSAANRAFMNPTGSGRGPRQEPFTVALTRYEDGRSVGYVVSDPDDVNTASPPQELTDQLIALAGERQGLRTVDLQSLGRYRVTVSHLSDRTVVAGLPTRQVDAVVLGLVGLEAILTVLALVGAVVGGRALIARSLRPLNRLAATATQVSRLPLDRGEVALAVRVPEQDTDPRSEVGQVGVAFNHMLGNVDGALAARHASESKLRQFVADASHELRNPLAAIRGYSELTRRSRAELTADTAFAMSRVESEADRMSRLVEDMLLLARLDSGPNLDVGPTDLTETLINATADARAAGPDHRWSLELPDEPVVVTADRHRIHQVVANLLANARTHTPPGTAVRAGLRIDGDRAVVTVSDDGPGIPAEIRGRVFERFTRADSSRARASGGGGSGSTGLGLAIVAAVVEAHRGDVWVESRPGLTEFSIALPLQPVAAAAR